MSICVYARLKDRSLDFELFFKSAEEYFGEQAVKAYDEASGCEVLGKYSISYISDKKPPYSIYDSEITKAEFEYGQMLIFELDKDNCYESAYKEIIGFIKNISENNLLEILVTSDVYDEICLFRENEIIWKGDFAEKFAL